MPGCSIRVTAVLVIICFNIYLLLMIYSGEPNKHEYLHLREHKLSDQNSNDKLLSGNSDSPMLQNISMKHTADPMIEHNKEKEIPVIWTQKLIADHILSMNEQETVKPNLFTNVSPTTCPSTTSSPAQSDRTVVIIVSDYRSGSSLLGEMFNQNDEVYYLFEPLSGLNPDLHTRATLTGLLTCEPPRWGFIRRNRQHTCQKCDNREECRKFPVLAAKFIRIRSLEDVFNTRVLEHANVRLLHSFRDPRGTINSRLAYPTVFYNGLSVPRDRVDEEVLGDISSSLCTRYLRDSQFADMYLTKHQYLRMRYEELVQDPQGSLRRAYSFVGRTVPGRVRDWFRIMTHGESYSAEQDKMGNNRDAEATAVRWKQELGMKFICVIERECRELFEYVGLEYYCSDEAI